MSKLSLPQAGDRFGRWVVQAASIRKLRPKGQRQVLDWFTPCQCDCGTIRDVNTHCLVYGKSPGCGCRRRLNAKHGHLRGGQSPEYIVWNNMRQRCENPSHPSYPNYGGRGITVCPEWDDFAGFLRDMGLRPSPEHSLDRINNELGYFVGNVRWVCWKDQCNNQRRTRWLTHEGETLSVAQWAARLGLKPDTLHTRLRLGWSVERALTEPLKLAYRRR